MRKLSRQVAYLMMSLCIVTGLLSDLAHAQSAKDLVGAWIAVSNVAEQGGVKSEPYGATPQGILIFESDGRYGLILSRNNVPKFASNSRTNGTADENKAAGKTTTADRYDLKTVWGEGVHSGKHGGAIFPDTMRWVWRDYAGVKTAGK